MSDSSHAMDLIRRGQAAARVGRRQQAREYLRSAVELDPRNVQAWLDLAGVEDDPDNKRACFERVLAIDPVNDEAQLGLEMLDSEPEVQPAAMGDGDLDAILAQASQKLDRAVGPAPPNEVPLDDEVLYCANHPDVQTMLRCNRCGKLICTRCAVRTPVGYRCKQCVGQQQAAYFTGGAADYVIGGVLALVLGGIASFLMSMLGAWFFALILGPTVGVGIAEAVRFAVRRRRSRYLWAVVGAAMVVGALPALAMSLLSLWSLLTLGLFLVLAIGAAAARLR